MDAYELVLSESAAMVFATAARSEQRRVAAVMEQMKVAPMRRGDLQERDAQGRDNEILVVGDWVVTYWPDHATREIRVVRLERVEG